MVSRVIRPTWVPQTDEHRRLVAELVAAADAWREAEAQMWAKFEAARSGGVALVYAAERADVPRATLYRHLPRADQPPT